MDLEELALAARKEIEDEVNPREAEALKLLAITMESEPFYFDILRAYAESPDKWRDDALAVAGIFHALAAMSEDGGGQVLKYSLPVRVPSWPYG